MKRDFFNLGYTHLSSADMGELIPIGVTPVLPGDSFSMSTQLLIRCAPMLTPPMHPVDCMIHHWYVPNRLIWDDWENFITGGPDGDSLPVFPTITAPGVGGFPTGSLADYLKCPVGVNSYATSALPFRAYAKIYNEFYRDQDLITPLTIDLSDGPDTTTNTTLQYAPWEKDYFTTSRPWTQKGPEVAIPLTGDAPVKGLGIRTGFTSSGTDINVFENAGNGVGVAKTYDASWSADGTTNLYVQAAGVAVPGVANPPNVYADLSDVTSATVNDLRLALALQRYEENRARYGSRYAEYLQFLGVKSSDGRLQRPEYLGGGKQKIQFSEVLQTAEGSDPVGTLRGHGIGVTKSNRFRRFFEEHGYVITLMSVKPKTIYTQGSPREYNRRTKEDFWQRELQHIGQQEVLNKEIYAAHASPDGVFGYQDRYDEYRRSESCVTSEFRTSLLYDWHFARIFGSAPALNGAFVSASDVPQRPFANTADDVLYIMAQHSIKARRLVSKSGKSFIY